MIGEESQRRNEDQRSGVLPPTWSPFTSSCGGVIEVSQQVFIVPDAGDGDG